MSMTPQNQQAYNANKTTYPKAYAAVSERYHLRAKQRDMLDVSPYYPGIMDSAIAEDWFSVEHLLNLAGIVVKEA